MVLGFMTRWGKPARPTGFEEKILDGRKKHTLRADEKDRWHKGRSIQFVVGNRTKQRRQFMDGTCTEVQEVELRFGILKIIKVYVDGRQLTPKERARFIHNDGFDSFYEFNEWFEPIVEQAEADGLSGVTLKLIHWTELTY